MLACQKESIAVVELGKPVPNYTFNNIVNSERDQISLKNLKGKAVVLEFWATWCGPCIPAMKKLNKLKEKFGDDLEVITISQEENARLERFIKTTQTSLTVVSDTGHANVFPYKTIPHSVLIDKNGIVRAITSPENITEEVIEDVLADKEIALEVKDDFYVDPTLKVETLKTVNHSDYRIVLKNYNQEKRGGSKRLQDDDGNQKGVEMYNTSIPGMFMNLLKISSPSRVVYRDGLSKDDFSYEKNENMYNMTMEASENYRGQWRKIGADFLNDYFDVNARMTTEDMDCYILEKTENIIEESTSETSEFSFMGPIFKAKKIKIGRLVEYIENFTAIPVTDQTGLEDFYDIELNWQAEDPKTIHRELAKYGLKLKRSSRKLPIKVMEIYKKKA